MSELVLRNSELVGYVEDNEYELTYQENKGLAISGRQHEVARLPMSPLEKLKYKYSPEAIFFRNGLLGAFALDVVNATVYDIPDGAHNWMIVGVATTAAVQYANSAKKRDRRNKAKNTPKTLEIATGQPEVMYIPSSNALFNVATDEELDDNLQILNTFAGCAVLESMNVEIDVKRGILNKMSELWKEQSNLRVILDASYRRDSLMGQHDREALKSQIIDIDHIIDSLHNESEAAEQYISELDKTVAFDTADVLNVIIKGSVNKGQLISDAQQELGTIVALMEERLKLQNAIDAIPYADRDLHGESLATIRAEQKQHDLQILSELITIKKMALAQQADLLELYADGVV